MSPVRVEKEVVAHSSCALTNPASALLVSVCVLCMHCWFPGIYFACTASFQVHTLRAQLVMMGLKVICCGVGANISIK